MPQNDPNAVGMAEIIKTGDLNQVMENLKSVPDFVKARVNGESFLHIATSSDKIDIMEFFMYRGISPDEPSASGAAPLHKAVSKPAVETLLLKGAGINARDNSGRTPIHVASLFDRTAVIDCLILKGADVNIKDSSGTSALGHAIAGGHLKLIDNLLNWGADPNNIDNMGDSPLHTAVLYENAEVVKTLSLHGANVNIRNNDGMTPLGEAKSKNLVKIIMIISQFGGTD